VEKTPGQIEKEEMMDRMNADKERPTDRVKKGPKGERRVSFEVPELSTCV
jgi:hypothetical protein